MSMCRYRSQLGKGGGCGVGAGWAGACFPNRVAGHGRGKRGAIGRMEKRSLCLEQESEGHRKRDM